MPALHWICALTLTVVCCLTAQPLRNEYDETIELMDKLMNKTGGCLDSEARYYTPTDVNEHFLVAALNCSIAELDVLFNECNDEKTTYDLQILSALLEDSVKEVTPEPQAGAHGNFNCHISTKQPWKTFLKNIETLWQRLNSQ